MSKKKGIKFICDMCGSMIEIGRARYTFRGELFCAYDGGTFDECEGMRQADFQKELEHLIRLAEQKPEKELADEVYYQFNLDLCSVCRKKVYETLDLLQSREEDSV
ncbi:MAG: hypothetical protein RBU29_07990 [bacterium]|jgi:hypothetical protein|nr:hypothetical protein [bacterium]